MVILIRYCTFSADELESYTPRILSLRKPPLIHGFYLQESHQILRMKFQEISPPSSGRRKKSVILVKYIKSSL